MYRLAIFDCDGVLVDSEPLSNRIFAEELNRIGLSISYAEVCRAFIGLTMSRCMEIVEERLGHPAPDDFLEQVQARTFEGFRRELQPVPGVLDALERIDMPVCVASSGEPEKIRLSLGLVGLLERFEGRMFSATEVGRSKPAPDLFLRAAARCGVAPADCAVIEDSLPGVQAGIAAGMTVFGFAAREAGDELGEAGARVFRRMSRLPELLAGSAR